MLIDLYLSNQISKKFNTRKFTPVQNSDSVYGTQNHFNMATTARS